MSDIAFEVFELLVNNGMWFLGFLATAALLWRIVMWYLDEMSGRNYYKCYPVAEAMDKGVTGLDLEGVDFVGTMLAVDRRLPPDEQVQQLVDSIRQQKENIPAASEGHIKSKVIAKKRESD